MNKIQSARLKYKPDEIKILFVAEAPPENLERFFYYENVKEKDALFINLVRLLYPETRNENGGSVEEIRNHKKDILERFKKDGYYLIDALPEPISLKLKSPERIKLIKARQQETYDEIKQLIGSETKIILLKATVYDGLLDFFLEEGLPVVNDSVKVPFPNMGHSARFATHLHKILALNDMGYRGRTKFVWYSGDVVITKG